MGNLQASLAAAGAGIAGGYATVLAATSLYDLVPQPAALAASAVIAGIGVATALAWNAQLTAVLGLVGAMLGPELIEGFDPSAVGATYVAVGLAAAIVLGIRRGWTATLEAAGIVSLFEVAALFAGRDPDDSALAAVLIGAFALLYLVAALGARGDGGAHAMTVRFSFLVLSGLVAAGLVATLVDASPPGGTVAVIAVLWLAYLASGVFLQVASRSSDPDRFATLLIGGSVSLAFVATHVIFDGTDTGYALLVVAAVTAAPVLLLFRVSGQRDLWTLLWASALAVLAVAVGHLLGGDGLVLAWAAQGALAAWLAVITKEERLQLAGAAYLGLAIGHTLMYEAPPEDLFRAVSSPESAIPAILFVSLGAAVFAAASRIGRLSPPQGFLAGIIVSGTAALYAASFGLLSVLSFERAEAAITVLWAAVALALLLAGLAFRSLNLHWAGLALFTIAALKLVVFDVGELSEHPQRLGRPGLRPPRARGRLRGRAPRRSGASARHAAAPHACPDPLPPGERACGVALRSSRCSTARPAAWTSRVRRCSCSRRCTARSPRRCSAGPNAATSRRSSGVSAPSSPRTASPRIFWTDSGSCSPGPRSAPVSRGSGARRATSGSSPARPPSSDSRSPTRSASKRRRTRCSTRARGRRRAFRACASPGSGSSRSPCACRTGRSGATPPGSRERSCSSRARSRSSAPSSGRPPTTPPRSTPPSSAATPP